MNEQRLKRLQAINELIQFIVNTDKDSHNPTLGCKKEGKLCCSHFTFADNGLLYYIDSYTEARIRPLNHYKWKGFNGGGTMREVVQQFGTYIMHGKQGHLNDYKEMWGWSYENTMSMRQKALKVGFIRTADYPYERWGNTSS